MNRVSYIITMALVALVLIGAPGVHADKKADEKAEENSRQTDTLSIATKEIEPFVFARDELRGFSIDIWEELAQAADLDYEFVTVKTVTEQLDAVEDGEVDAAIAAISITQAREENVDFSFSYFDAGLGILAQQTDASPVLSALRSGEFIVPLVRLFSFLLVVVIVAGHVIWLLERKRDSDFPKAYLPGVWEGIWWAAVTVTTVGYGDRTPRGIFGRIFGLFWMFAGLFIIANFTAGVTSRLTVQQIQGAINGPQDLPGKIVVTVEGSTADQWLTEEEISHRTTTTIDEAYTLLDDGHVQAVVYDYPVLRYYANLDDGKAQVAGPPFNQEDYGIAFPTGSPLREEINRALLQLREDGT